MPAPRVRDKFSLVLFLLGLVAATAEAQQVSAPSPHKSQQAAGQTGVSAQQPAASAPASSVASKAPEQPKPTPPDKVVLKVGEDKVTAGELYQMMGVTADQALKVGSQARRSLGDQYALTLSLAHQAVSERLDSTPEFAQQIASQRNQLLAQMEYKNLTDGIKVSQEDISQYYSSHKDQFERAELRRVYVRKKPEGARADAPGLAPQEARAKAEAISKEWAAGKDPREIEQEAKDPKTAYFDQTGERIFIKELPEEFQSVVMKLKPGQLSGPIESPQGYLVLQLVKRDYPELKDISTQIGDKLRSERIDAAIGKLKRKANVWMDDEYFSYNPAPARPSTANPAPPPSSQSSQPPK